MSSTDSVTGRPVCVHEKVGVGRGPPAGQEDTVMGSAVALGATG
jgi:hypothetical protein